MLRSLTATLVTTLLLATTSHAADRPYDFRETTLDNGLRVITLEDHSCPIVAVQVWYRVGSKDEDPKRQGFAHMFEHMMFRGTDRLGPKDHFNFIRRTGGDCNAYTSFDNTTYINDLPSNQLELALWLESERMAFLKIDQESFNTERKVVEEERRMGLNRPYGKVPEQVLPVMFHEHPYKWMPIGQIPHLRAAKLAELSAFWDQYYVPNNAALVIVGDIKHDNAQQLAKKYFGWIPKCPEPKRVTEREPEQKEGRTLKVSEEQGPIPAVAMIYRTVPRNHPDAVPLEMLISILGGGQSSRLYLDLVKTQDLSPAAMAGAFNLEHDGLAAAGAALMPWGNRDKVLAEIEKHIQKLKEEPVTPQELEKARNQMLRSTVTSSLTAADKATQLGRAWLEYGNPDHVNTQLADIRAVTASDLQRVATLYLKPERCTTLRIEPTISGMIRGLLGGGGGGGSADDEGAAEPESTGENMIATRTGPKSKIDRPDTLPETAPVAKLSDTFPQIGTSQFKLDNGLQVVVVPNNETPFVTMTLGLKNGAWTDDPAKPGVASMTLALLTEGTESRSARELAEETDFNALTLSGSAGLDVATVSASCVSDKVDKAMELLADVIQHPTFPEAEFKTLSQQLKMGLMISSKTPDYLADRELRRRMYGNHPYARTETGEIEDIARIKTDDLKQWWQTYARPSDATLYIAGDVTVDRAREIASQHLGGWTNDSAGPQHDIAPPPTPSDTTIYLVDRPGLVQSQIRAGHISIDRTHADYHASRVLSQYFGGGFNSRLNDAIRVKKGLTYGARGSFSARRFGGQFVASTFTKTANTAEALQVMLDEIKRLRVDPATPEELDMSRSYLVGKFAGERETPQDVVGDLWLMNYCGLPSDYLQQALSAYKAAGSDELLRIAKEQVHTDTMVIVVVGDAKRMKADLEKIAPVVIVSATESGS